MNLIISDLRVPVENDTVPEYLKAATARLGVDRENIKLVKIISKSLDSKNKEQFFYELTVVVTVPETFINKENLPPYNEAQTKTITPKSNKEKAIIIGFGPAGMFAALELIERGIKPVIFERGKKIEERSVDVEKFFKERTLDPESNIQFGEGGAGSYSDGKLFSRMGGNTGYMNRVFHTLIKLGAPEEILYINKPHLGTDMLCKIVKKIRGHVLEYGEIFYSSKMTDLIVSEGRAVGVVINGEREFLAPKIYLAIGHSARETFDLLQRKGVALERKPISVGLRIEHPAEIINLMRYGDKYKNYSAIGPAFYSFTHNGGDRGVCSFCMCPGGEVLNASSENALLAVNGMSYSARSSKFSNSAIVVACQPDDYGPGGPLAGIEFQKDIERKAFSAGGGNWKVPAQNLPDFLAGRTSKVLNTNSCRSGTKSADLNEVLPRYVCEALRSAFNKWKQDYPAFVSENAVLLGAETRTTCPVRIKRGDSFESESTKGLYPIGEGSGHAGGITSSAIDALKAVEFSQAEGNY